MLSTPAVKRTPVEIWRNIFELFLGPSLLEPEPTLWGYQDLLHDETALLQDYVSIERERGVLRLVCRSWNELANTMGDRIVISYLDEYDWPPHRSREDADFISYRHFASYWEGDPVIVYRRRIGQEIPSRADIPIKLGSSLPLAPKTLLFSTNKLDLSSIAIDAKPADIHFLSLGPCADIYDVAHPIFSNVRVLHLRTSYPFEDPEGMERNRTLPNLRCLLLVAESRKHRTTPTTPLSAWHFPKLAMFRFTFFTPPPLEDLANFIYNHAATLEELDLNPFSARYCAKQVDWSRFLRLKLLTHLELSSIADALPTLARRWQSTGVSSADVGLVNVPTRLTIMVRLYLSNPRELSAEDVIARLQPYHWTFPLLHLQINWKRDGQRFTRGPGLPPGYSAKRSYVTAFLAIIDQLQLPVFDVTDTQSTDATSPLRAFVSGRSASVSGSS